MLLKLSRCRGLPKQRSFSLDVYAMRDKRQFTQERMAEFLDVSVNAYKKIECGHIPKTGYFLSICWKLRLNPFHYLEQALRQEGRNVSVLFEETETVTS